MKEIRIIGIHLLDRIKEAGKTQKLLTEYSDYIKTRLGFHEVTSQTCSRNGLIVIEMRGNKEKWDSLQKKLDEIEGITVKDMNFKLKTD